MKKVHYKVYKNGVYQGGHDGNYESVLRLMYGIYQFSTGRAFPSSAFFASDGIYLLSRKCEMKAVKTI